MSAKRRPAGDLDELFCPDPSRLVQIAATLEEEWPEVGEAQEKLPVALRLPRRHLVLNEEKLAMKKSLVSLAALAAAGAASAQSSMTLFGVVDTAITYIQTTSSFVGIPGTPGLNFIGAPDRREE